MIDLKNIHYKPNIHEIEDYIGNSLFTAFYGFMNDTYKVQCKIEYSKDVWVPGWNIKLRKGGKSLCVVYPREGYFTVLVVIGNKERERAEQLLPLCSEEIRNTYRETKEGNGQRWLMIDVYSDNEVYRDILELIRIRRESR